MKKNAETPRGLIVYEDMEVLKLSKDEVNKINGILENPPEPNEYLMRFVEQRKREFNT